MSKPSLAKIRKVEAAIKKNVEMQEKLRLQYDELERELKSVKQQTASNVTVEKRKASIMMTRDDGLAIVFPRAKKRNGYYDVYWYDGKRGDYAIRDSKLSWLNLQVWLATA